MALLEIKNVTIKGISACVPPKIEETKDISLYSPEEVDKVIESTGVERKHIVSDGITASDLCLKACRGLINDLNWDIDSIDAICNVTQTSDYTNHPNVFVLHDKLNLKEDCLALDLFHGCPGWVLGLSSISSLMSLGTIKRALLFDGDILTSVQYRQGKESRPLFGDCGTATALEFSEEAPSEPAEEITEAISEEAAGPAEEIVEEQPPAEPIAVNKKAEKEALKEEKRRLKEQLRAEKEAAKREKKAAKHAPAEAVTTYAEAEEGAEIAAERGARFKKGILIFVIILVVLAIAAFCWYKFMGTSDDPQAGPNAPQDTTQYNDIDDMINDLEDQ